MQVVICLIRSKLLLPMRPYVSRLNGLTWSPYRISFSISPSQAATPGRCADSWHCRSLRLLRGHRTVTSTEKGLKLPGERTATSSIASVTFPSEATRYNAGIARSKSTSAPPRLQTCSSAVMTALWGRRRAGPFEHKCGCRHGVVISCKHGSPSFFVI